MSELDDLDLRPTTTDDLPADDRRRPSVWVALAILAALVGGVLYFIYGRKPLPPQEAQTQHAAGAPAAAAQAPEEPLPALDASDELVRGLVKQLSSHPTLLAWLATENLVRTFTTIVDKIAIGVSPAKQAPFAKPSGAFAVTGSGEDLRISDASFARYDSLGAVIGSIDAEGAARVFQRLKPLMEQAHRDLGYPAGDFDTKVNLAVARLLETPLPDGPLRVKSTSVNYQFADEELESLMPAQKQLLRMGPKNQKIIQDKLRAFIKAAGLTS